MSIDNNSQQQAKDKSRTLSTLEFLEALQLEWIVADLRFRIYTAQKDKKYYTRVKEGKKLTIDKLANKHGLPTIFDDEDMLAELRTKIYRNTSHPTFVYRDDDHRMEQEYYDLFHYYSIGSEVSVDIDGELKTGKITYFEPYKTDISVKINGVEGKYSIKQVTRIL